MSNVILLECVKIDGLFLVNKVGPQIASENDCFRMWYSTQVPKQEISSYTLIYLKEFLLSVGRLSCDVLKVSGVKSSRSGHHNITTQPCSEWLIRDVIR